MRRLKKDDSVIVIAGNHKGLTGNILKVIKNKVIIQGVNVRKKHMKASEQNPQGSILQIERPINISNVALCIDGKPVKLRAKKESGKKTLYYKSEGKEETYRELKG